MSNFNIRFTTCDEGLPKIATMLGTQNIPATRYVEYDRVTRTGIVWYAARTVENDTVVRCVHDSFPITNDLEFRSRIVAWLENGEYIAPGWPEGTRTCEDSSCMYVRAREGAADA